jgi:spermidine/putrescine transport system substrate-binding protein
MPALIELNLLKPIDHAAIPNMKNLKANFVDPSFDRGNTYSVGWQWGTVGIVYNKEKFAEPVTSWKSIFEPADGIKFMLFDSEREMIGAALRYKGYSINTLNKKELRKAADLMIGDKKKKGFMGFEGNVGGRNKVIAGTVDIAMAYNGDVIQSMAENDNIGFVNPKEGTVIWLDSLCIPVGAPNPALAMKFMNYILDPEVGAQLSNFNQFATPNKASMPMINKEDLANPAIYPDAEAEKRLEYINDLGKNNAMYSELWKMIKTR